MTLRDEYLWMLGKEDLLRERVAKFEQESLHLKEEENRRQQFNIPLDMADQKFLLEFDNTIGPILTELAEVSAEVDRLRESCKEQGLMDTAGNLIDTERGDNTTLGNPRLQEGSEHMSIAIPWLLSRIETR